MLLEAFASGSTVSSIIVGVGDLGTWVMPQHTWVQVPGDAAAYIGLGEWFEAQAKDTDALDVSPYRPHTFAAVDVSPLQSQASMSARYGLRPRLLSPCMVFLVIAHLRRVDAGSSPIAAWAGPKLSPVAVVCKTLHSASEPRPRFASFRC